LSRVFQTKKSVRDSVDRARLHPIDGSGGWSTIIREQV
jgi:hypothetical protein